MLSAEIDIEFVERGYLLTGQRNFLARFERNLGSFRLLVAEVRQLTRDDPPSTLPMWPASRL